MTTDVRTLLHDTAESPSRAPDLGVAMQRARARRRRHRGFGALAAVVVAALVVGALALGSGGGDGAQVAIGTRQAGSDVAEGWKTVTGDPGVTMSVPGDWQVESPSTTPTGVTLLGVHDLTPDADDVLVACTIHQVPASPPSSAGSAVTLWEFPGDATQVTDVTNAPMAVVDRPATFAGALVSGPNQCEGARFDQLAFRDGGRVFLVRVVSVFPTASDEEVRLALAAQVLDTLRVTPLGTTATTTAPTPTVIPELPAPPSAPTTPFVPSTTDEQQINDLVVAWLRYHPDDETRSIVEDADALLPSIHEGLAQHSASDLLKYSGTVSAIRMLDADHAEVDYILLFDGRPQFGVRTGIAVRINGHWMVSRVTECSLLSLGGITCPTE